MNCLHDRLFLRGIGIILLHWMDSMLKCYLMLLLRKLHCLLCLLGKSKITVLRMSNVIIENFVTFFIVFWRSYRGDIHFAVAGVWNNIFASVYALMFWFGMWRYENIEKVGNMYFTLLVLSDNNGVGGIKV